MRTTNEIIDIFVEKYGEEIYSGEVEKFLNAINANSDDKIYDEVNPSFFEAIIKILSYMLTPQELEDNMFLFASCPELYLILAYQLGMKAVTLDLFNLCNEFFSKKYKILKKFSYYYEQSSQKGPIKTSFEEMNIIMSIPRDQDFFPRGTLVDCDLKELNLKSPSYRIYDSTSSINLSRICHKLIPFVTIDESLTDSYYSFAIKCDHLTLLSDQMAIRDTFFFQNNVFDFEVIDFSKVKQKIISFEPETVDYLFDSKVQKIIKRKNQEVRGILQDKLDKITVSI